MKLIVTACGILLIIGLFVAMSPSVNANGLLDMLGLNKNKELLNQLTPAERARVILYTATCKGLKEDGYNLYDNHGSCTKSVDEVLQDPSKLYDYKLEKLAVAPSKESLQSDSTKAISPYKLQPAPPLETVKKKLESNHL
jgi:hypothetical protein